MFYIKNISIFEAIRKLHLSGTHDYFRTYLTLKAHGMKYGSQDYVPVNTQNTAPAFTILFGVPGLSDDQPFYNPLRNELLTDDTPRGTVQTHVKKFIDGATKTKMVWLDGRQLPGDATWYVRFGPQYPRSLGKGEDGLASKDDIHITIHRPSFIIWMNRNSQWADKPNFSELWRELKTKLNFTDVETDLLFTDEEIFDEDPFIDIEPDRDELVEFILQEAELKSGRDVLKLPDRHAFTDRKINRIVASHDYGRKSERWWGIDNVKEEALAILEDKRALLLIGSPGTGKTRLALQLAEEIASGNMDQIEIFQFHAGYSYEDFIESLRPQSEGGILIFQPTQKRFVEACKKAETQIQVVILDEFNRADVTKVFGEAFLLIEKSYRDKKYSIPYIYGSEGSFWIPPDLYVIATLNNLDKSTYDLDFALRRRFGEVELLPNVDSLENIVRDTGCNNEDFIRILRSAFQEIQQYYPLGHAYFVSVKDRETLRSAYRRVIRPTVEAYLGQFRSEQLDKIDNIFKQVIESPNWGKYIELEE